VGTLWQMTDPLGVDAAANQDQVALPAIDHDLSNDELRRIRAARISRRIVRVVGGLALLFALYALNGAIRADEMAPRRNATFVALVAFGVALLLFLRPTPVHPVQAVVGSVLLAIGGIWLSLALVSIYVTWVIVAELLPEPLAQFLLDIDVHKPEMGLLMLGIGLWAIISATRKRQRHSPVVLYGDDDVGDETLPPGEPSDAGRNLLELPHDRRDAHPTEHLEA